MTKKIGGWYRIGIVLSIIWVLLVSGIAIYECFRERKVLTEGGFIGIITRSMFFNVEVVEDKKIGFTPLPEPQASIPETLPKPENVKILSIPDKVVEDKKNGFIPLSPSTKYELKFKLIVFLSVLFLPILGMWGLLLGIVRSILWIKEGFKKQ